MNLNLVLFSAHLLLLLLRLLFPQPRRHQPVPTSGSIFLITLFFIVHYLTITIAFILHIIGIDTLNNTISIHMLGGTGPDCSRPADHGDPIFVDIAEHNLPLFVALSDHDALLTLVLIHFLIVTTDLIVVIHIHIATGITSIPIIVNITNPILPTIIAIPIPIPGYYTGTSDMIGIPLHARRP